MFLCSFLIIAEYIEEKKPLGGLLLLLPQVFNPQNIDSKDEAGHDSSVGIKEVLLELERLLVHANIPVSEIDIPLKSYVLDFKL